MSEALWRLENVCLGTPGAPRLDALTLTVRPGATAVLGPSGAGKTSLANLLVGFESPTGGTITATLPDGGAALPLYWAPQDGGLWPHKTVLEHLETVRAGGPPALAPTELLARFDMAHKAASLPGELSEGQRDRVAVARALATGAAVVVMDEPLASVDTTGIDRYWDTIREVMRDTGASLVFATHSAKTVLAEADRVICLAQGRLLYDGQVDQLYWHPGSREQAECLGEANWLEPDEALAWFRVNGHRGRCYRPEQIAVEADETGPIVVEEVRFKGAVEQVDVRDAGTGRRRRFHHRPRGAALRPGMRVVLKLLGALVAIVLTGCAAGSEPALKVATVHHWAMSPDGRRVPAPRSVAIGRNDEVVVLDTAGRVLVFDAAGRPVRQWRMPESEVGKPEGVCVLVDGRIMVADTHYHRVVFFDANGTVLSMFGREGTGPGEFLYPVGVAQDDDQDLYVCEYGSNDRVQKFTRDGAFVLEFGSFGTGPGQFQRPSGLAWHDGTLYVADAINNRIQVYTDAGTFVGVLGDDGDPIDLAFPYDICLGADGALYVVEYGMGRIAKVSLDGRLLARYGGLGSGLGQLRTPWGIAVDRQMRLRVADTGNRRIVDLVLQ